MRYFCPASKTETHLRLSLGILFLSLGFTGSDRDLSNLPWLPLRDG